MKKVSVYEAVVGYKRSLPELKTGRVEHCDDLNQSEHRILAELDQ